MPARPNVPQRTSLAFKTSDGHDTALFVAVPEVLQSGRGREAGADAEGAAGQHSAGLQKGREVMKFKAETIVNFVELSHYHYVPMHKPN